MAAGKTIPRQADPPPNASGAGPIWPSLLATADAAKGKWMLVRECETMKRAGSLAGQVRKRHDPAGKYEIVARGCGIYVRLRQQAK